MLALLLMLALGCGDDDVAGDGSTPVEGGNDAPAPLVIAEPQAAAMAEAPRIAPCPSGWSEAETAAGTTTCEPYALDAPACADDEARFAAGCEPVGLECPRGRFADDVPVGARFVDPGADAGGDGSREQPFRTIAEAAASAELRLVIALSRGVHVVPPVPDHHLALYGACVSATTVRTDGAVVLDTPPGLDVEANDLTIDGEGSAVGFIARAGSSGSLRGVRIVDTREHGVAAENATLDVERVVIDGVAAAAGRGVGFSCSLGATCHVERLAIRDVTGGGVLVGASTLVATRLTIEDTSGDDAAALYARPAAEVTLTRVVADHAQVGFVVQAAHVTVTDFVVRATDAGTGMLVYDDGVIEATRGRIARARLSAATAFDSRLSLSDVVIDETEEIAGLVAGDSSGLGVFGSGPATVQIARVAIEGGHASGVFVDDGARIEGEDLIVRDVEANPGGKQGFGINVGDDGVASLTRVLCERNRFIGVTTNRATTTFRDLIVRDTRPQLLDGDFGVGILVRSAGDMTIERALLDHNHVGGLVAQDEGTRIAASDLVVSNTLGRSTDGHFGRGVEAQGGARIELARAAILGNRDVGVSLSDAGTWLEASDLTVAGTAERECLDEVCTEYPSGVGIRSYGRADGHVARFASRESALCGLYIAALGALELEEGLVSSNPVGACVDIDVDLAITAFADVRFEDNGSNLESRTLPLPDHVSF